MSGQEIFTFVIEYLQRACNYTLEQIALVFGPAIVFGFLTQYLSQKIRVEGWARFGDFYTYFTAPGTALHEFGHVVFAKLFGHEVTEVCWFGPKDGTLGYVNHSYNPESRFQQIGNLFIGTGPIWVGTLAIVLLSFLVLGPEKLDALGVSVAREQSFSSFGEALAYAGDVASAGCSLFFDAFSVETLKNPLTLVCLYLIFCIGAHMRLSPPDVRHCGVPALMLLGFIFLFNLCTAWLGDFSMKITYALTQYNHVVYSLLVFTLLMMLLVWALTLVVSIFLKRKPDARF